LEAAGRALGPEVRVLRADVRVAADVEAAMGAVRDHFGKLDILFANAGIGRAAPLESVTEAQIDEQLAINFKGVFFTVQRAVPMMGKGGSIVLNTSFLDEVGIPGLSILAASKAAVRSLVRTLAAELAPRGIRVNGVSPGLIDTPFHGKLGLPPEHLSQASAALGARIPLGRFGDAAEIAKAVAFLAGDDASFATGSELAIDGGFAQV
jgi:NAD(P)-dependent dehydrogenase (short-subunit alcohol dehydrogenase family)